jgi:hypothetical protein
MGFTDTFNEIHHQQQYAAWHAVAAASLLLIHLPIVPSSIPSLSYNSSFHLSFFFSFLLGFLLIVCVERE